MVRDYQSGEAVFRSILPEDIDRIPLGKVWRVRHFHRTADGAIIAEVRQSVRDLEGRRTGLRTRRSDTFFVLRRAWWLASTYRMPTRLGPDVFRAERPIACAERALCTDRGPLRLT